MHIFCTAAHLPSEHCHCSCTCTWHQQTGKLPRRVLIAHPCCTGPVLSVKGVHKRFEQSLKSGSSIQNLSNKRAIGFCRDATSAQKRISVSVKTQLRRVERSAALLASIYQLFDGQLIRLHHVGTDVRHPPCTVPCNSPTAYTCYSTATHREREQSSRQSRGPYLHCRVHAIRAVALIMHLCICPRSPGSCAASVSVRCTTEWRRPLKLASFDSTTLQRRFLT